MNKQEQREIIKNRLEKIDCKGELDEKIFCNLVKSNLIQGKNICIYNSYKQEVDTKQIINYCLEKGLRVFLPVSKDEDIVLVQINKSTKFVKGKFGILEPIGDTSTEKIDVCITPLLGYDKQKHRLGKGKGYYDRFFKNNNCKKIALAYSCQELDQVIVESYDAQMDYIVNENGVI